MIKSEYLFDYWMLSNHRMFLEFGTWVCMTNIGWHLNWVYTRPYLNPCYYYSGSDPNQNMCLSKYQQIRSVRSYLWMWCKRRRISGRTDVCQIQVQWNILGVVCPVRYPCLLFTSGRKLWGKHSKVLQHLLLVSYTFISLPLELFVLCNWTLVIFYLINYPCDIFPMLLLSLSMRIYRRFCSPR